MEKHDLVGIQLVSLGDRVRAVSKEQNALYCPGVNQPRSPLGDSLEGGLLEFRNREHTRALLAIFKNQVLIQVKRKVHNCSREVQLST